MKKIFILLAAIGIILLFGSCSLIGGTSTTASGTVSSNYPASVVYKIVLSKDTYLCSSFSVSNTDAGVSLQLNEVYSLTPDGKITWIGAQKAVSAVIVEKVSK